MNNRPRRNCGVYRIHSVYTLLAAVALLSAGCKKDAPAAPPSPTAASANAEAATKAAAKDAPAGEANAPTLKPARKARWVQLFVDEANASSFLKNDWNRFVENDHPKYLFDDNPRTAWVEGAEGNGEGEWVRFSLTDVPNVSTLKLEVKNGDQKSKKLLVKNAAPTKLRVVARYRSVIVGAGEFALERKMGVQTISLPLTSEKGIDEVRLQIGTTIDGTKYKDTCISDVAVFVHTDVRYKEAIEKKKQQRLLAWTKARLSEAARFKKLSKTYPYAKTTFRLSDEKSDAIRCGKCDIAALKRVFKGEYEKPLKRSDALGYGTQKVLASADEGVLVPDGLDVLAPFYDDDPLGPYQPGALVRLTGLQWTGTNQIDLADVVYDEDLVGEEGEGEEGEEYADEDKNEDADEDDDEDEPYEGVLEIPVVFKTAAGEISAIRLKTNEGGEGHETESEITKTMTMLYVKQRLVAVVTETRSWATVYRESEAPNIDEPGDQTTFEVSVAIVHWNERKTKVDRVSASLLSSSTENDLGGFRYDTTYTPAT